ncbi:MAG: hypothetical protein KatS3mg039_1632 [Candidatus Kapaibacterium sp.]|nr:MAG: hypothetical protein KatS3mg039_1632 [Candidatus Kapabacteria bacterium]
MKQFVSFVRASLALLAMLLPTTALAQLDIDVGTGTSCLGGGTAYTGLTPYSRWYSGWRTQYIIPASELTAAGMPPGQIVALSFNVCSVQGDAIPAFTIKMANVNFSSFTSTAYYTGTTTVFGPQDIGIPTMGWNKHQFSTPFLWDGTSNLLVEVCSQIPSGSCGTCCGYTLNCGVYMTSLSYSATLYYYTDGNCNTCNRATGYGYYALRPNMRFSVLSGIEASFPDDVDPRRILRTDSDYDGSSSSFPKPSLTFRVPSGQTVQLKYKIVGPLPSTNVVYRALNSANVNDTIITVSGASGLVTRTFNFSTGALGAPTGQTIGNGTLYTTQAIGGSYRVEAEYRLPSINYTQVWNKQFIIAYSNDIALADIIAPRRPPFKYLRGVNVPIAVRVQNVGLNPATNFRVIALIKQGGTIVKGPDTVVYNQTPGLATGQTYTANFPYFNSLTAGTFTFETWVELLNGNDQNTANNVIASVLPPGVTEWTFDVQYDTEVETFAILKPTSSSNDVYVNRPYNAVARFRNNGAADQSDVPTTMTIERWNGSSWDLVFQTSAIVPDISATPPNTTDLVYAPWTPQQTGLHRVCVTISAPGDPVTQNNTLCQTFTVGDGLSGTYTIGTANAGSPRNFTTIQDAVDALYARGVSGPVTFELTDGSYTVGSLSGPPGPALDLSSKILGVSATNTITFKPSLMRSLTRGSVMIRLQSQMGIGIYIAQNLTPSNPNAVQNTFKNSQQFANPTPYIRFDGGDQKSLRFLLDVGSATPQQLPQRAVFYLGTGASSITIKNCLIENWPQSSASYASDLPTVRYIAPNFTFESDVRQLQAGPSSYAAGVVLRSVVPSQGGVNAFGLDTLTNDNNTVEGCEISGFGYGVVALGVGPLFYNDIAQNNPNPRYQRYYSKGNVIRKNVIMSVGRAGVYCGYTENTMIEGNRILNVGVGSTGVGGGDAAGIMVGGKARPGEQVYNNVGVQIVNNEVSHISSDVQAWGVLVEQTQNTFVNPAGGTVTFPDVMERTVVKGNIVWGISRTSSTATAAGIHLTTRRSPTVSGVQQFVVAASPNYLTRGDRVLNNTVILSGDNVSNGGSIVGIGIQGSQSPQHVNNAIAVTASSSSVNRAAGYTLACLFYQGVKPSGSSGLQSNTNAYWYPGGVVMARFVEDIRDPETGALMTIDVGSELDYQTLAQWKSWMKQDLSSVVGNFVGDYVQLNTTPPKLRVRTNPPPTGSILDRRGERLGSGEVDLDGDGRGVNGAKYSIGGDEFVGNLYVNDLEALEILSPSVYRASVGTFSDAEYVMTQAPINVVVRVRNNGSATQSGVQVQGVAEMEQAPNVWVPVGSVMKVVQNLPPGGVSDMVFDFNLQPQTYGDMGQVAPSPFGAMSRNVTPRYRVRVQMPIDENVGNNMVQKEYRFYLLRSPVRMLVSASGASVDANNPAASASDRVGRLNYDSLMAGFGRLNLPQGTLDVFDRQAWEPRAVNYTMYKQVWWVEDQTKLTRTERDDLAAFVAAGSRTDKRNLVVSSQEIVKSGVFGAGDVLYDNFVKYVLRLTRSPQGWTPRTGGYHNYEVEGVALAQGIRERVLMTQHAMDQVAPMPSLVRVYSDAQTVGQAQVAYRYVTVDAGLTDNVMGVATSALGYNVVALGVDWRHYGRLATNTGTERMIRSVTEYLDRNGDVVLSAGFGDIGVVRYGDGTQARLWWETVSERGVSHFVVERRAAGQEEYRALTPTVVAAGESTEPRGYSFEDRVGRTSSYEYRVGMVSRDGSVTWSRSVVLSGEGEGFGVSVHPQPVSTELVVEVSGGGDYRVELVDMVGRRVEVPISGSEGVYRADVSGLPSGVYTVVVRQGEQIVRQTVTVVR